MEKNGIIIILCISIFFLIIIYKRILTKKTFKDRKPLAFEEIYNVHIKNYKIGYETFISVYNALGEAYSVNPQLIRPTDRIKIFQDIDSWVLDKGTEEMEEWLSKTLKIKSPTKEIKTVLDILIIVENSSKND